ncbi:hypothetical protein PRUB_a3723 [Pseudoalteromonas rubra]|uniref:Uncharacterized protein n=1 Tax=Pseudoalteromonas rubra TaxID=43658 RepID=A0A8T0C8A0_9GAMM|nr:hypothetical protein PRUB_a3723 [Pseudoalteromonas rubra]
MTYTSKLSFIDQHLAALKHDKLFGTIPRATLKNFYDQQGLSA